MQMRLKRTTQRLSHLGFAPGSGPCGSRDCRALPSQRCGSTPSRNQPARIPMHVKKLFFLGGICALLLASPAFATTISVTTATDLVNAITTIDGNGSPTYVVNFTGNITLTSGTTLPAINTT